MRELLELGASGYLMKSASLEELLTAVRAVAEGPMVPQRGSAVLVLSRDSLQKVERGSDDGLSAREREILLLVARGMSNRQIADSLSLAEATVKRHLANLYPKLGVGSRGEAVTKALSEGYLSTLDVTRTEPERDKR